MAPLQPYLESIPGTTIHFTMVPMRGDSREPKWIAATEVTWDLYDLFVYGIDVAEISAAGADAVARPSKPYLPPDRGFGHAGYPAMSMSLHAAQGFCRWLTTKTGRPYRLPTELEWKLACDGLSLVYDSDQSMSARAWFAFNADERTHPVGQKQPNELGIFDMEGNVSEWCVSIDGNGVALGGSYLDDLLDVGCGARKLPSPNWNASDPQIPKSKWWLADCGFVGFRVVCDQTKEAN